MQLILRILGVPMVKQSARFGKTKTGIPIVFQSSKVKSQERSIKVEIINQLPKGFKLFEGCLYLTADFIFPIPKSCSKKLRAEILNSIVYKQTRPDLTDNLMKGLCDAMNNVVFKDDSQIVKIQSRKIFGEQPRTDIMIYEV